MSFELNPKLFHMKVRSHGILTTTKKRRELEVRAEDIWHECEISRVSDPNILQCSQELRKLF